MKEPTFRDLSYAQLWLTMHGIYAEATENAVYVTIKNQTLQLSDAEVLVKAENYSDFRNNKIDKYCNVIS